MEYTKNFSIAAAFSYAWGMLFKHAGFLMVLSLIPTLLASALMYARFYLLHEAILVPFKACEDIACLFSSFAGATKEFIAWKIVFAIVTFMVSAMVISVAIRVALDIYYTGKSSLSRISWVISGTFVRLLLGYICAGALFVVVLACLLLPKILVFFWPTTTFSLVVLWFMWFIGFIILMVFAYSIVRMVLAPFYMVDKKSTILTACKASYAMTKQHVMFLLGLMLIIGVVIVMSMLASALIFALVFKGVLMLIPSLVSHVALVGGSLSFVTLFLGYFFAWLFFFAMVYAYDKLFKRSIEVLPPNPMQVM